MGLSWRIKDPTISASGVKTNRLMALEGLRGIAAVVVVFFHSLMIFYPSMFYGSGSESPRNSFVEDIVFGNPLAVFISGTFAVAIFFVLSGFVLSIGFFQTGKESIVKKLASKRYLRLMLPALASVLIAWLLLVIGLSNNEAAFAITNSDWLNRMWSIEPEFFRALTDGLWGIFTTGNSGFNPVLWTMIYELIGSFVVFGTLLLFGKNKYRWLAYLALILFTYKTWYLGFIIGMALADLYSRDKFPFNIKNISFGVIMLAVALFIGGYPHANGGVKNTVYETMFIGFMEPLQNYSFYLTVGASLLIVSILVIPKVKKMFEHPLVSSLGKYTYSLYLIHKPVLFTVCTGLFVYIMNTFPGVGFNKSALISIALTLPVIALATWLFERYIDAPSIRFSSVFARWIEKGDK